MNLELCKFLILTQKREEKNGDRKILKRLREKKLHENRISHLREQK